MWPWRRRRLPPPVLLPSLDRLAELIERVVALLDQVSLAPAPLPRDEIESPQHDPDPGPEPVADGWVAFVHSPDGYRLLQRDGPPPDRGAVIQLDQGFFAVLRLGPSPLPGDARPCAYVEKQERPSPERTFDR